MGNHDWAPPRRFDAVWFWLRVRALSAIRTVTDWCRGTPRRWAANNRLADAPVVAHIRLPLWTEGRTDEFVLVAGKVQNLRVARPAFDAVEVPADAVLSFWRQLGRPRAGRGFVVGREVRSGCVVPTMAGGICQISNALATCAQRAGFELVERHGHSARIEAGFAASDTADQLDATVFWNHIDLRIRATAAWRIELQLTADDMLMTLRSHATMRTREKPETPTVIPIVAATSQPIARSCVTCLETQCFRHQPAVAGEITRGSREAWLLDAWTPEFARYLEAQPTDSQRMILTPARVTPRQRQQASGWHTHTRTSSAHHAPADIWTALRRALWLRRHATSPGKRQASLLDGQRWLAQMYLDRLTPTHCRLIIDQALLPYMWRAGVLAGRHYDVLVGALPIEEITRRLNDAAERWPSHESLRDFRADPTLPAVEMAALRAARTLITPHTDIAAYLVRRTDTPVHRLDWIVPTVSRIIRDSHRPEHGARTIVLAASALPRKGACELAIAVRDLRCRVRILGSLPLDAKQWAGIDVQPLGFGSDWLADAHVVVLPAYVEHAPRAALAALAAGIQVIVSPACGLTGMPGVIEIPAGDANQLRAALIGTMWPGTNQKVTPA